MEHENGQGFLERLVVGADGSTGSQRAIEWSARLASAVDAEVLAVHVLTYSRELLRDVTLDTMRTWRRELQDELEHRWAEPLAERAVRLRCLVVEDQSASAGLLAVAARERADGVVVGAQGHGGLGDRVLGGVSHRVTHRSRCPVIVVPRDWTGERPATGQ
jgi:nucleotide-binding universal stress UspA family protein